MHTRVIKYNYKYSAFGKSKQEQKDKKKSTLQAFNESLRQGK